MTTTTVEPWQLTYDDMPSDGFPDGLRISTDCAARRVIEPIDPERYHEFPEHLGHRGHGFERILQEWMEREHGARSVRELVVPWEYGETHLDLFLHMPGDLFDSGGQPVQLELKANKDAQVRTENVRQVQRQMYVAERMHASDANGKVRYPAKIGDSWEWFTVPIGDLLEAQWRILVIDPTTWRIPDPRGVRVTLTDERRAELDAEWDAMRRFMAIESSSDLGWIIEWPEKLKARTGIECSCGKCFRPPLEELPKELYEHAALHLQAQEEERFAKDAKQLETDYLKSVLKRLVAERPDALEGGRSWVGGGFKVTLTKSGSIRVTRSAAAATVLI